MITALLVGASQPLGLPGPTPVTIQATPHWVSVDATVMRSPVPYERELQTWRERHTRPESVNVRLFEVQTADVRFDIEGGGDHARGWSWWTGFLGSGHRVPNTVRFVLAHGSDWFLFETTEPALAVKATLADVNVSHTASTVH